MIMGEARRSSGMFEAESKPLSEGESEELNEMVIQEQDEEQEPGPELTPEGKDEAEKVMKIKQQQQQQAQ